MLGAGVEHLVARLFERGVWTVCGDHTALSKILEPQQFFAGLDALAIPHPETRFTRPERHHAWLSKIRNSCGGMGVRRNAELSADSEHCYWQQEISGVPISALCLAQVSGVTCIGINRQFVNHRLSPDYPYIFAGLYINYQIGHAAASIIDEYLNAVANYFNYTGVFSLDMIYAHEGIYVLEMNPRISASFELYEEVNPELNLVDAHIRVCDRERSFQVPSLVARSRAYRIVYASADLRIPESISWPEWVKDRPASKSHVAKGDPLCSVHCSSHELTIDNTLALLDQQECELLELVNS